MTSPEFLDEKFSGIAKTEINGRCIYIALVWDRRRDIDDLAQHLSSARITLPATAQELAVSAV